MEKTAKELNIKNLEEFVKHLGEEYNITLRYSKEYNENITYVTKYEKYTGRKQGEYTVVIDIEKIQFNYKFRNKQLNLFRNTIDDVGYLDFTQIITNGRIENFYQFELENTKLILRTTEQARVLAEKLKNVAKIEENLYHDGRLTNSERMSRIREVEDGIIRRNHKDWEERRSMENGPEYTNHW